MAGQLTCNVFPTCSVTDCESTLTDWESILVAKDYWYMSSWLLRWNSMKRNVLASWRPVGPEKADRAGLLLTGLCHWRSQLMTEFYLSIDGDLIHLFFDFSRRRLVDLISCSSRGLFFYPELGFDFVMLAASSASPSTFSSAWPDCWFGRSYILSVPSLLFALTRDQADGAGNYYFFFGFRNDVDDGQIGGWQVEKNVVKQGQLKSELSSIPSLMDVFVSDGPFNSIFSRPISILHAPIIFENAIAGHVPLEAIDQSAVEIIKIIFVFL